MITRLTRASAYPNPTIPRYSFIPYSLALQTPPHESNNFIYSPFFWLRPCDPQAPNPNAPQCNERRERADVWCRKGAVAKTGGCGKEIRCEPGEGKVGMVGGKEEEV